ncbi:MAG: lysophospholipid acyltransferase family protein [Myxococcota bacterium]|nr:lysophospholipid acyltransferase family protein [Myxococcota bacterium]
MFERLTSREVADRVALLDVPFNEYGYDQLGTSRAHVGLFYECLKPFYRHYFRVRTIGLENLPSTGRGILIGNHSGSVPSDGGMVMASLFFDLDPPRLVHGMVEKFAQNLPFLSSWFSRIGQLTGLPEHAERLLNLERLLLVFPEGTRGIGKLYEDRYQLERFGTGFMRIALKTNSPIIPFAYVGAEESFPAIFHSKTLARLARVPYWPVPPYLVPVPMPVRCLISYGAPMVFEGTGHESDDVIDGYVQQVRAEVARLIKQGRSIREATP